jgi:hypothetical protein
VTAGAERLGFTFEGIFRQAVVYKGIPDPRAPSRE